MTDNYMIRRAIPDLLNKKYYIPEYQRGYRWEKTQVLDLLQDLYAFFIGDTKGQFYCLQPIVVKEKQMSNELWYEVIDGQQRLTTIRIIMQIYDQLNSNMFTAISHKYTIMYATRPDMVDIFESIKIVPPTASSPAIIDEIPSKWSHVIDSVYIYNAAKTILKWFMEDLSRVGVFSQYFYQTADSGTKSVQVVWYETNEEKEPHDIFNRMNSLKAELQRIDETKRHKEQQISLAEQELKLVKSEIRTDKLKSVATDAATAIASGVGSLFGSGKLKELERTNEDLHQEIAERDKGIDTLKIQMQEMQERHGKQIRNLQSIHNQELEAKDSEISRLNTLLEKAFKWFPMLREMLRMEKLCVVIGFTKDMINSLLTKKEAIRCNGRIYSEEHRRKFDIKNDIFKVEKNSVDENKLELTINRQPIGEWFKKQFNKPKHNLHKPIEESQKSKGFRI